MKRMLSIVLVTISCLILVTGCIEEKVPKNGDTRLISEEPIGGIYDASILYKESYYDGTWYDLTQIQYTKDGKKYIGEFIPDLSDVSRWIKMNASSNCTVLCGWRYGHMLEGYAERNIIARFASLAIKDTILDFVILDEAGKQDYINDHEWEADETIEDIAKVLTSDNISSNETRDIIQKYNVSYILTQEYDSLNIAWIFFEASGKNRDEYIFPGTFAPTEKGEKTLIFQMWNTDPEIPGLQLVYEHHPEEGYYDVRIFEVI